MQSQWQRNILVVALLAAIGGAGAPPATAQATSFSGSAVAVDARKGGKTTTLVSTGTLLDTGDAREASAVVGAIPDLLSGESLHATAIGKGDRTNSEASVAKLSVVVDGNTITADLVMGRAAAICTAGGATAQGNFEVTDLTLNGQPVTVTGVPNQTVSFSGGQIVINERRVSVTQNKGEISVTGLRISASRRTDLVIGSATAGTTCGS